MPDFLGFGAFGHLLPIACAVLVVVVILYAILLNRFVNDHLPPVVRRLVNNPEVKQIVTQVAHQVGLDNDAKRQVAATAIRAWVMQHWGIPLPEHLVNLAMEILVHQLKDDGLIPQSKVAQSVLPALTQAMPQPVSAPCSTTTLSPLNLTAASDDVRV